MPILQDWQKPISTPCPGHPVEIRTFGCAHPAKDVPYRRDPSWSSPTLMS
jgi:hypothetical protein